MSTDALDLFRATRPQGPPVPTGDIRAPTSNRSNELHSLAMVPGSPSYNARIPKPPCYACGEDHFPTRSYDHEWTPEPAQFHDEPVSANPSFRRPEQMTEQIQAFRVALYVGRGDTYVVAVETPPDWDQATSWKVEPALVLPLINLARALGQKVIDRTGGDLVMLEQEYAGQHAQDHGRGAQGNGSDSPRRPGPSSLGTPEGWAAGANAQAAGDDLGGR